MRYSADHALKTRERLLTQAGRLFRAKGYAGVGVEALATTAEVTTGAIYRQFGSKAKLFAEVVRIGMQRLKPLVDRQRPESPGWIDRLFADYLSERHVADAENGCVMPSLAAEVARANVAVKQAFEQGLCDGVDQLAPGLEATPDLDAEDQAWVVLAMLTGGAALCRAVADPATSRRIADAMRRAAVIVAVEAEGRTMQRRAGTP